MRSMAEKLRRAPRGAFTPPPPGRPGARRPLTRAPLPRPAPDADDPDEPTGPLTDLSAMGDRYEVVRCLGSGAIATVYEVRCKRLDRRLALKVLRPDAPRQAVNAARLEREAESLQRLSHPNCVRLIEWGRTDSGGLYLVMELAPGRSLLEDLAGPIPVRRAVEIVRQVLLALDHAHRAGVIHRDVKPENVTVSETKRGLPLVKVLDFGFCRLLDDQDPDRRLTGGYVMGTPTYMAPELLQGADADERSDLYGVGAMLFYLLTGRKPFEGSGPLEILRNKAHGGAPALGAVAPGVFCSRLEAIVDTALRREPQQRYASARQFAEAIVAVQREPGGGLATEERSTPAPGRGRGLSRVISACRQLLSAAGVAS
jgi:serine/threonine-protein kinase